MTANTEKTGKKSNPSDHLANERTFLAWLRTGIGIMAFGFVVVKFSLFVKQLSAAIGKPTVVHSGYSGPIGIVLVVVGALSLLLALIRYEKTKRQLLTDEYQHTSGILYFLVAVILLMSIALILYLVKTT